MEKVKVALKQEGNFKTEDLIKDTSVTANEKLMILYINDQAMKKKHTTLKQMKEDTNLSISSLLLTLQLKGHVKVEKGKITGLYESYEDIQKVKSYTIDKYGKISVQKEKTKDNTRRMLDTIPMKEKVLYLSKHTKLTPKEMAQYLETTTDDVVYYRRQLYEGGLL